MFPLSLRQLSMFSVCLSILLVKAATCPAGTLPIQFSAPATHATAGSTSGLVAADFNGDGNPDLAATVSGSVQVLMGSGDGTFRAAVGYPAATSSTLTLLRAADVNGDGRPDLALIRATGSQVSVFINSGDGTFQPRVDYAIGGDMPLELATADLNADGRIDLAIANEGNVTVCVPEVPCTPSVDYLNSANVTVLLGNGDGTFQAATRNTINGRAAGLAVLDANADGTLDLAALNSTQTRVSLLHGLGNGLFQSALGSVAFSPYKRTLRSTDFNRDGIADLFMSDDSTAQASLYLGSGNGQYQAATYASVGREAEAYDLDSDGIPDLIGLWNGYVYIALGTGDATFHPAESYTVGGSLKRAAIADFDRDGLPDLAFASSTTSGVAVLLNRGFKLASPSSASFTGMNLNVASSPKIFTITNSIGRPLAVSAIAVTGTDSAMFGVAPGGPSPCATLSPTLAPGESCTLQAVFTPTLYSSRSANLAISSDHPETPLYTIPVTGQANPSPLTVNWAGNSTGTITVLPSQSYTSGPRTLYYYSIDTVTLQATPTAPTGSASWSGCETVDGTLCTVTMDRPHTVTATFDTILPVIQPVFLESTASYFQTLASAYDSAGNNGSIAVVAGSYTEQLQLSRPGTLRLRGGCDGAFSNCTGVSTLVGGLVIDAGDVTLENFQLSAGTLSINNGGSLVASNVTVL